METLWLVPFVVLAVSLAQRRLGDRAGGRLAAVPLAASAVIIIVVLEQDAVAAQGVALGIAAGAPIGALVLCGYLLVARGPARPPSQGRLWPELVARVVVTTGCVAGVAMLATVLPPAVAGLVASFPTLVVVLAVMTHRRAGAAGARGLVRGVFVGMPASVVFVLTLAGTLGHLPVPAAFAAATVAWLAGQYVRDRVDAVVKVRLRDHQRRRHPERRVVRFLAQHATRHQFLARLTRRAPARSDLDTRPQPAAADLGDPVPDQRGEPLVQVRAERDRAGQEVAVPQQPDDRTADRTRERVAAER